MSIYEELILDHYRHPHNFQKLNHPSKTVSVLNPSCGDSISLEIVFKEDEVSEVGFTGQGCVISIASASILTDYIKKKTKKELASLTSNSILKLLGIQLSPTRLRCALLPWEALMKMIKK